MPTAAPHPCAKLGCRALVPRGVRYCVEHTKSVRQADDERRGSAAARGYDRQWQRARASHLAANPLCVMCEADGVVIAATIVDHIVSIRQAPERRLDPSNWRSLCKRHHDQRTASDQAWGRGGPKV